MFDLASFLKTLTMQPGVYQMFSASDHILYIGKARHLRLRVKSYFNSQKKSVKTERLMQLVARVEVIVTATENEALLLESNLIKQHKPPYNILLRDDKSYPFIHLSDSPYPAVQFYRGKKTGKGRYFGPYPSGSAVKQTLNLIEKVFRLRTCRDSYFRHRTRPCLQYQIGRCTGPCVQLISAKTYQEAVDDVVLFLSGKQDDLIEKLTQKMLAASENQAYETAKTYRDQISALRDIQSQQRICGDKVEADVIAVAVAHTQACVEVMLIRDGMVIGNQRFFFSDAYALQAELVLASFIEQYYTNTVRQNQIPKQLLLNREIGEVDWLADSLSHLADKKISLKMPKRGAAKEWVAMAQSNAELALSQRLMGKTNLLERYRVLQSVFDFPCAIESMECFDVSHTMGEATVASCVVFDTQGPVYKAYRCYNIQCTNSGDDYAALKEALIRRYTPKKKGGRALPDLLLIDGGLGQYHVAKKVLAELGLLESVLLLGVAKGVARKPGLETLIFNEAKKHLPSDSAALHLIQQIRDEAHRYAITGHRRRRDKRRLQSQLEVVPGIGKARRQRLLQYFGGFQGVSAASVSELAQVSGISQSMAQVIYSYLHER